MSRTEQNRSLDTVITEELSDCLPQAIKVSVFVGG